MSDAPLEILLDHLKQARGFDFTGYKRATLERRIRKRMDEVGVSSYVDYLDYLEVNPDEFAFLFNTVLINVTGFFRDEPAWDALVSEVVPQLLAGMDEEDPIRAWSAGCATGEEPYTLAILLAETLGQEAYVRRVKIYATDVDMEALDHARHAAYSAKDVENLPREILDRYFVRIHQRYVVRPEFRRAVIFGRNDLVQDAPISRIDLLTCRNTLMYFNAETQAHILARLHFALNNRGYLLLGKSEMLITHSELFRPVNLKRRIFQKVPRGTLRERLLESVGGRQPAIPRPPESLPDAVFDAAPAAQIVVDPAGDLLLANGRARELFHIAPTDVGRPLKDLEVSYRPVELRSHLETAYGERRAVVLEAVATAVATGDVRDLQVHVTPIASDDTLLGATVIFQDVTQQHRLQEEIENSRLELENAYEELQSTVEELETTNEELQSTNEELETTNEELQSTNEELETMNEELQSTNEELETMNDELRTRSLQLNDVNGFLEGILTSIGVAVVVVDREQVVQVWNAHSTDLWGLRPEEVEGRHLLGLDIGLPIEQVRPSLLGVLAGREGRSEVAVSARNRRGREIGVRVTVMPLVMDHHDDVNGAIVLMEELDGAPAAESSDGDHR